MGVNKDKAMDKSTENGLAVTHDRDGNGAHGSSRGLDDTKK